MFHTEVLISPLQEFIFPSCFITITMIQRLAKKEY